MDEVREADIRKSRFVHTLFSSQIR
jgi:hypothetical protein